MEKEAAPFEHVACVIENCELEMVAEATVKDEVPMSDTVMVWLPLCPLKPMLPAENSTTGAETWISGVTQTASATLTVSGSKTSGNEVASVT